MGLIRRAGRIRLLGNLRIRAKLLVALLPLALMVIAATLYSSLEMLKIDTRYSHLIANDVEALQSLTLARVMDNRYHQILYQHIAETDPDKMRSLEAELDQTASQFHSNIADAMHHSPT